jgi:hypothetical protein
MVQDKQEPKTTRHKTRQDKTTSRQAKPSHDKKKALVEAKPFKNQRRETSNRFISNMYMDKSNVTDILNTEIRENL